MTKIAVSARHRIDSTQPKDESCHTAFCPCNEGLSSEHGPNGSFGRKVKSVFLIPTNARQ